MSKAAFKPFYADGQEVRVGDRLRYVGGVVREVTNVFPPEHEVSCLYSMENGCAEIAPATIESLPLDEDIDLIERLK